MTAYISRTSLLSIVSSSRTLDDFYHALDGMFEVFFDGAMEHDLESPEFVMVLAEDGARFNTLFSHARVSKDLEAKLIALYGSSQQSLIQVVLNPERPKCSIAVRRERRQVSWATEADVLVFERACVFL